MMEKRFLNFVLSALAVLFFAVPIASAADEPQPPLAELWLVTIKADQSKEFYEALGQHMAFRSEQGDPRDWQVYSPLLGDELNRVAIRFCCSSWADQDAYREWGKQAEKINAHFNEHVAPHAANYGHYFESMDWANSHWSEAGEPYKMFAVTEFHIKPGMGVEFDAARDKMSQIALNQGWASDDHSWLWATTIGGKQTESIIIPYRNFAEMDRDETSFSSFLSEHLGAEAAADLLRQFSGATRGSDYQIWVHQDEYSMSHDD